MTPPRGPAGSGLRLSVTGAVQGVGFRPCVFRRARELGLAGWVRNGPEGVEILVEGADAAVAAFEARLRASPPPRARVHGVRAVRCEPTGLATFEILASGEADAPTAVVLADGATCDACLREVLDPGDRRHAYPFANCTECGPRFTIVERLPYDRANTTMRRFALCDACRREYDDPADRRFHAQPIACPACGPRLALWDPDGLGLADGTAALDGAVAAVASGRIVAAKGLGGFHLIVDARDDAAVTRLRGRKHREEKPFALMVRDVEAARGLCEVDDTAARLLASPEAPIVLLPRRDGAVVAPSVAPRNPRLGVMLPATPLHHLMLRALPGPVVATSGNRSDEPICTDEREAVARLRGIADVFLVHDRPVARPVDDSVVAVCVGAPLPVRRARGYAPLPVRLRGRTPCVLALGGHLKNTIALAVGDQVFVSQHVGDLGTPQAQDAFERVVADFLSMYRAEPEWVAHDLHPDYASTRWIEESGGARAPEWRRRLSRVPRVAVQHHHAHLAACLAENGHDGPALGVTWDGTGLGSDGTTWGGEFLLGDVAGAARVASLRPFRLPGGEAAVHEPRRVALALLWEIDGPRAWETFVGASFSAAERRVLDRVLAAGRAPVTTSAGRLFDAVASILGLRQTVSFEGQAAMELEAAAAPGDHGAYALPLRDGPGRLELDWEPLVREVVADRARGVDAGVCAARFHESLARAVAEVAARSGDLTVALTGGCFQNLLLTSRVRAHLEAAGRQVLVHREVPPGDGGISLGQVAVAAARARRKDG
jgi:hydrogenase maturation protein HypF